MRGNKFKVLLVSAISYCLVMVSPSALAISSTEIIFLAGKGEKKLHESSSWAPANLTDKIGEGGIVRTLMASQMGLLLPDRTQIRLNQNSQLQIKLGVESAEWAQVNLKLSAGRAWSQARPQTGSSSAPVNVPKIRMETPSATLAIRGTDWEVEVRPDGATQLVVLSGKVNISNEQGELDVGKGEAAIAEPGKAPTRLLLVNPQSRVQWVSSWQPHPYDWVGAVPGAYQHVIDLIDAGQYEQATALLAPSVSGDPIAAVLSADVLIAQGQLQDAVQLLQKHPQQPVAIAMLARTLARLDRTEEARTLIKALSESLRNDPNVQIAYGELSLLEGDVKSARLAFGQVLTMDPHHAEAWYGLGLIESERENVALARQALNQSLSFASGLSKAESELAMVEAFAGNLELARKQLESLLSREPDNYLAQTALGITLLKSGQPAEALDAFLKAGIIEPRYARVWLYSGVAFYQMGDRRRAVEAFNKAAELDTKDPLPHLLESLAIGDSLEYGLAIEAAQRAQERMPNLKSLNQVANDQKGSANLGYALANFGLNDWATWYAHEAYSPFWAGSHLFLADRYTGKFSKNSELYQGFLTDPSAFGASNRDSTLILSPGHYAKVDAYIERTAWDQAGLIGTVNGLVVAPVPLSYFISGDISDGWSRSDDSTTDGKTLTVGLGMRPRHDVGVFAYGTKTAIDSELRTSLLTDDQMTISDERMDVGINFKPSAMNQIWLKAGTGRQSSGVDGVMVSQSVADALNTTFATNSFVATGRLEDYNSVTKESDFQARQSIGDDEFRFNWGVEHSSLNRPSELVAKFFAVRMSFIEDMDVRSTDVYLSGEWRSLGPFRAQADAWVQEAKLHRNILQTLDLLPPFPSARLTVKNSNLEDHMTEVNPRLGVIWDLQPNQTLRLVGQRWRRPAAVNTLGPVDTVGVPVNDQLPLAGGLYERARIQFDQEQANRWYLQAFLDHEHVDNGIMGIRSSSPNLELDQLESLRNRREVFASVADIEKTPNFEKGNVDTLGFAGNLLLNSRQSLALRYLYRDARQKDVNDGLDVPYLPRHMLRLNSQWILPNRILLGANTTYRSKRFQDDLNTDELKAGWAFGMTAYWESVDKRSSLQGILENLLTDKQAGLDDKYHLTLRYTYKF